MSLSNEDLTMVGIDLAPKKDLSKSPRYIAYANETNNGCDYTIACGKVLWELKAETKEEALVELRGKVVPSLEGIDDGTLDLESVTLYQVSSKIIMPIEEWYAERKKQEEDCRIATEREKDRSEYERLKTIFEQGERE